MDMHTHAHVQVCTHLSAPEHKHRQIRVHTYLHTHTCKQLCTQPFAFPCVHSTQKYTHAHLCTSTGVQTCTYPQVQSPISTHTHKHTHFPCTYTIVHMHTHAGIHCIHLQAQVRAGTCASYRCAPATLGHSGLLETAAPLILGTLLGRWGPSGIQRCPGLGPCPAPCLLSSLA